MLLHVKPSVYCHGAFQEQLKAELDKEEQNMAVEQYLLTVSAARESAKKLGLSNDQLYHAMMKDDPSLHSFTANWHAPPRESNHY
jgi:hypothetical protein